MMPMETYGPMEIVPEAAIAASPKIGRLSVTKMLQTPVAPMAAVAAVGGTW